MSFRIPIPLLLAALAATPGCSSDDGANDAQDARDVPDEIVPDSAEASEASPDVPVDVEPEGTVDAGPDAAGDGPPDGLPDLPSDRVEVSPEVAGDDGAADLPDDGSACEYIDLDLFLVVCGADFEFLFRWVPIDGDLVRCPPYYDDHHATLFEAIDALGRDCDKSCIYHPSSAVMFLDCGHRNEYTVFEAEEPTCPDWLQFSDGFYATFEEWRAANPCPDPDAG